MSPQLDSLRMSESYFSFFMGFFTKLALLIHMPTLSIFFSPPASFFRPPQLEGKTSVPFVDGVAEFTRLRVDREASRLSLSFTTLPERFQSETSIEFSVVPFHDSVERKQVSFLLSGVPVPDSVKWRGGRGTRCGPIEDQGCGSTGTGLGMSLPLHLSSRQKGTYCTHARDTHTIYGSPFVNIIVPFIRA